MLFASLRPALASLCVVVLTLQPLTASAAVARRSVPQLQSESILVVDRATGKTLYQRNPDNVMPIASITKLMTAIVVMESRLALNKRATVTSEDVDRIKWSRSRLPVGAVLRRSTMLHIALMSSENRAAFALSRQLPGGRDAFVDRMNRKARSLGMAHTHFEDPAGLSPTNVSTARDLRRLMSAAYRYDRVRVATIGRTRSVFHNAIPYVNSNALVRTRGWHIKMQKTGFTNEAGHCLVMVTPVRGRDVDIVILGGPNNHAHYDDARAIVKWLARRREG